MNLGSKLFKGFAWSALDRIFIQGIQFVLGIVLARILSPKEYGTIGILLVFITVSQVFIDSGFTKALIQKKKREEIDVSTVFCFNLVISLICYIILYFFSPIISNFYEIESLTKLLRVLALTLIFNAFFTVPITILTIDLNFKKITKINLIATILAGLIAILMALSDYGVWSLVYQFLIKSVLTATIIWAFVDWKPKFLFSITSFKEMFKFGSNLLISSLLNTIVNNFSSLFIAKVLSTKDLGYYTRGTQFADFIFNLINSVIERVLLPGLATIQDNKNILIDKTRKILKGTTLLIIPIFIFLSVVAEPLIKVLLTDKWSNAIPILQIFCIARMITIISGINVNVLYVLGKTNLALKQQYYKIVIRIVFLLIAIKYGIIYIAIAELLSTAFHFFINTYYPGKLMKYGALDQIKDIIPIIVSGLLMGLFVFIPVYFIENHLIVLIITPIIALTTYLTAIKLFKVKEFDMLYNQAKMFIKNK